MGQFQKRGGVAVFGSPADTGTAAFAGSFGGLTVDGNAASTTIVLADTWYDFALDLIAVLSSNTVDWIISDEATGELAYQGSETFKGILLANMTVVSDAGENAFFRAIKNEVLSAIASVISGNRTFITPQIVPLLVPLTMVSGDTIRLQVSLESVGVVGITNMSMQAWPIK